MTSVRSLMNKKGHLKVLPGAKIKFNKQGKGSVRTANVKTRPGSRINLK